MATTTLPMVQPVTLETAQRYALNSGMMVEGVDISEVTDAETFLEAVREDVTTWLGATSGTTNISEGRTNWSVDHNGLRTPWVGNQHLDKAEPSIKAKLVEMTPANLKRASGAADIDGEDTNVVTVKPRGNYGREDYKTVIWFTNYGTEGIIAAILHNAICTTGLNWSIDDKKVATCDVEFRGHAADPLATDYLPIEYKIFRSSGTAAASEEPTSEE